MKKNVALFINLDWIREYLLKVEAEMNSFFLNNDTICRSKLSFSTMLSHISVYCILTNILHPVQKLNAGNIFVVMENV